MKTNNDEMLEVVRLFMDENDAEALNKLYDITGDKLVKILLDWREEYDTFVDDYMTYVGSMYNDVMEYVWEKYELDKINHEIENDCENEIE